MKKIKLIAIVLLIAGFGYSCSKQNESTVNVEVEAETVQYEQLMQELDNYSSDYITSVGTKSPFWRSLGRIVSRDAFGAIIGGLLGPGGSLLGAVTGSIAQFVVEIVEVNLSAENACDLDAYYNKNVSLYDGQILLDEPDSLGILHNQIIVSILEERPDIANLTDEEIHSLILCKMSETGCELPATSLSDYRFYANLGGSGDSDQMFSEVISQYPSLENELQTAKIYFDTIAAIDEEYIPEYTKGYKTVVDNSVIEETSKDLIKATISVAGSSKLLWDEESFVE